MRVSQTVTIENKLGLHARAATQLVQLANQFDATVTLQKGDKEANADSVLGLMMLESHKGEQVTVISEGPDAEGALKAIAALIADKFHEES